MTVDLTAQRSLSEIGDRYLIQAVVGLDRWLETMRGSDGYGGPVVHWWQHCLYFTGAGLDWRYEGIILGYLSLYQKTKAETWLSRARRAGDDLVRGQVGTGNFRNSSFEMNPYRGGTPHEAACDLALLRLAEILRSRGDPDWQQYAQAAEHNLQAFILGILWDAKRRMFRNGWNDATFVPNKAATIVEALLAWVSLTDHDELIEAYVIPTLDAIVSCQTRVPGHRLDGAIDQGRLGQRGTDRFFPFYIARCIPALLLGASQIGQKRYREAAELAMSFILRERLPDGSFPQVVYRNGYTNYYPRWVAGVGDILRAMDLMQLQGMEIATAPTVEWLLAGQLPSGGICTAYGFGSHKSQHAPGLLDFRDMLPVCGWVDKAFRYFASRIEGDITPAVLPAYECEMPCVYGRRQLRYREDATTIELWERGLPRYRWVKGTNWAEIVADQLKVT